MKSDEKLRKEKGSAKHYENEGIRYKKKMMKLRQRI